MHLSFWVNIAKIIHILQCFFTQKTEVRKLRSMRPTINKIVLIEWKQVDEKNEQIFGNNIAKWEIYKQFLVTLYFKVQILLLTNH